MFRILLEVDFLKTNADWLLQCLYQAMGMPYLIYAQPTHLGLFCCKRCCDVDVVADLRLEMLA